jgi:hypothetical protein
VFDTADGLAFVDSGWTTNDTGHTVHHVPCTVAEVWEGAWLLLTPDGEEGDADIDPAFDDQPLEGDRDQARAILRAELDLPLP